MNQLINRIFLISLLCGVWLALVASVQNHNSISDSTLNQFKLKVSANLTFAFMLDYEITKERKEERLSQNELDGISEFKMLISDQSIDTLSYSDIHGFLEIEKNGWSKDGLIAFQRYFQNADSIELSTTNLNEFIKVDPANFGGRGDNFSHLKRDSILENLQNEWINNHDLISARNVNQNTQYSNQIDSSSQIQRVEESDGAINLKSMITIFILVIVVIVLIAILISQNRSLKKLKTQFEKSESKMNKHSSDSRDQISKTEEFYKTNNIELGKKIDHLKKELNELRSAKRAKYVEDSSNLPSAESQNESIDKESENSETPSNFTSESMSHEWTDDQVRVHDTASEEQATQQFKYVSAPVAELKFDKAELESKEGHESFYKIQNKDVGTFEINTAGKIDHEVLLNSPEYYLIKACDYENPVTSDHTHIENVAPGEFKTQGDHLTITRKAKIRFV